MSIRTCKRLGFNTVAVYSKCDENALFVNQADEAVSLGAASSARETYLDMDKIINAALRVKADAIHPGNLSSKTLINSQNS